MHELPVGDEDIRRLARATVLLVACDYDGTLAELVDDPSLAFPVDAAIGALLALAELPDTHVAIISGRSLIDLQSVTGLDGSIHLIGGHGAEFADDGDGLLDEQQGLVHAQLRVALDEISASHPGTRVEVKRSGVALHHRLADADTVVSLLAEVEAAPHRWFGLTPLHGKDIVEFTVVDVDKGAAVSRLRQLVRADAVVFLGDDATDEAAFAVLEPGDLAVKVGDGPTFATRRVADERVVVGVLDRLVIHRRSGSF